MCYTNLKKECQKTFYLLKHYVLFWKLSTKYLLNVSIHVEYQEKPLSFSLGAFNHNMQFMFDVCIAKFQ